MNSYEKYAKQNSSYFYCILISQELMALIVCILFYFELMPGVDA